MQSLKQLQNIFSNYITENSFSGNPQSLFNAANYAVQTRGKRIRPLMVLASCQIFSGHASLALPQAYAIELFHNFTLVHDDIMDEAMLRRGSETVHKKFGLPLAVLSGDLLMIKAYEYLIQTNQNAIKKIVEIFNTMSVCVCEGQQSDMEFEKRLDVSVEEYLVMIEKKTAALLSAAFQMGAIVGSAPQDDLFHLAAFGKNLGLAFQLQDDFLDTFGNAETFGKKIGGDIFQNKKTWLLVSALSTSPSSTVNQINSWLERKEFNLLEKLNFFQTIYKELNLDQKLLRLIDQYFSDAQLHLKQLSVSNENQKLLLEFVDSLNGRKN